MRLMMRDEATGEVVIDVCALEEAVPRLRARQDGDVKTNDVRVGTFIRTRFISPVCVHQIYVCS